MPLVTRTISQLSTAALIAGADLFVIGPPEGPARTISYDGLKAALAAEGVGGEAADIAVAARVLAQEAAEAAEAEAAAAELARQRTEAAMAAALLLTGVVVPIIPSIASAAAVEFPAGVNVLQVQLRAPNFAIPATVRGKPFKIARMSLEDITAAGCYPDRAVFRTADRIMPDGSTDATNGGYWVNAEPVIEAEQFGQLHLNATETTAALAALHEMSFKSHRPGELTGDDYVINASLLPAPTWGVGGLNIRRKGPVKITVDGSAPVFAAVIYARPTSASGVTLDGAPLEIDGNGRCRYGVFVGHDDATRGGVATVRGITARNLLAGAGQGAAAVAIIGAYDAYDIADNHGINVNRAPNGLSSGGECKAVSVSNAEVPVRMVRCSGTDIYAQDDRDADALSIFGLLDGDGRPKCPEAIFEDCWSVNAQGRSIKAQAARCTIRGVRSTQNGSIGSGCAFSSQYGPMDLSDTVSTVTGAVGASYSVIDLNDSYPLLGRQVSRIERLTINSSVLLPRMVAMIRGAASPEHEVQMSNIRGVRTDDPAAPLFGRCGLEFNALHIAAASTKLTISVRDTRLPMSLPLIGYTSHNTANDLTGKLAVEAVGNRNLLPPGTNTRLFQAVSGSFITTLSDCVFGDNEAYLKAFIGRWDVNLATLRPGNKFVIDLAASGLVISNGPANLPASGKLEIIVGGGETTWVADRDRLLILGDGDRMWRTITGTWKEINARPMLEATATFDPASLALGAAGAIQTITVTGAAVGDFARASFSNDQAGVVLHAWVSAANTVKYFAFNAGGANPLDLASGTVKIRVEK